MTLNFPLVSSVWSKTLDIEEASGNDDVLLNYLIDIFPQKFGAPSEEVH